MPGHVLDSGDGEADSLRCEDAPLRSDGQIALFQTARGALIKIMVTLNTHRPGEHRYRIFGVDGGAEWFSYEGQSRRFSRGDAERDGWEVVPIGFAASTHTTMPIASGTPRVWK